MVQFSFSGSSRLKTLVCLAGLSLAFLTVSLLLEYGLHISHELSVFSGFFVLPLIYLLFRQRRYGEPLKFGSLHSGFLEGVGIYLIFTGYILVYFFQNPGFFDRYDRHGLNLLFYLFLTALNVVTVDFFTKRFIQYPLRQKFTPATAIGLQTTVWLAGHYPESLWLSGLMGGVGVWVFLAFTGIVTGFSYNRTENVSGQMTGHVLLNLIIVGIVRLC